MKTNCFIIIALSVAFIAACSKPAASESRPNPPKTTTTEHAKLPPKVTVAKNRHAINVAGVTRHYWTEAPVDVSPGAAYSLFLGFHGSAEETKKPLREEDDFDKVISENKLIVVYPETPGRRKWDMSEAGPDVAFFDALIDQVSKEYSLDYSKIYAFGHSNGAIFASYLPQVRPQMVSGAATQAGLCAPISRTPPKFKLLTYKSDDEDFVNNSTSDIFRQGWYENARNSMGVHLKGYGLSAWRSEKGSVERQMFSFLVEHEKQPPLLSPKQASDIKRLRLPERTTQEFLRFELVGSNGPLCRVRITNTSPQPFLGSDDIEIAEYDKSPSSPGALPGWRRAGTHPIPGATPNQLLNIPAGKSLEFDVPVSRSKGTRIGYNVGTRKERNIGASSSCYFILCPPENGLD